MAEAPAYTAMEKKNIAFLLKLKCHQIREECQIYTKKVDHMKEDEKDENGLTKNDILNCLKRAEDYIIEIRKQIIEFENEVT